MKKERKYPISEIKFKELIEPIKYHYSNFLKGLKNVPVYMLSISRRNK